MAAGAEAACAAAHAQEDDAEAVPEPVPVLCHSRPQARRHSLPCVIHSGGHLNLKFPLAQSCVATA